MPRITAVNKGTRGFATTAFVVRRTAHRESERTAARCHRARCVSWQVTRLDLSLDIVIGRPDVREEGGGRTWCRVDARCALGVVTPE